MRWPEILFGTVRGPYLVFLKMWEPRTLVAVAEPSDKSFCIHKCLKGISVFNKLEFLCEI